MSPGTRQNGHNITSCPYSESFRITSFVRLHCISLYKGLQSAVKHLLVNHSPYRKIRKKMHSLFITETNTREIFSPRTEFKVLAIKREILTLSIPRSLKRLLIQSFKNDDLFCSVYIGNRFLTTKFANLFKKTVDDKMFI